MNKRTDLDFSKHELTITKNENVMIHDLKVPNTVVNRVRFINTCGIMAVNGDYGNWIFCREFHPCADSDDVSDGYWIEKLQIASTQKGKKYDPEETEKALREQLNGGLEKEGYEGTDLEEMQEYVEGCLLHVNDEFEYTHYAYYNMPSFLDTESIIFYKTTDHWLKVVFDAFEEICKRLKEEE